MITLLLKDVPSTIGVQPLELWKPIILMEDNIWQIKIKTFVQGKALINQFFIILIFYLNSWKNLFCFLGEKEAIVKYVTLRRQRQTFNWVQRKHPLVSLKPIVLISPFSCFHIFCLETIAFLFFFYRNIDFTILFLVAKCFTSVKRLLICMLTSKMINIYIFKMY